MLTDSGTTTRIQARIGRLVQIHMQTVRPGPAALSAPQTETAISMLIAGFSVWRVAGPCFGSELQSPQPGQAIDQPRSSRSLETQAVPVGFQQRVPPPGQVHHVLVGNLRTSLYRSEVVPPTDWHGVERIGLDQSFLVRQLHVHFRACRQATVLLRVVRNSSGCPCPALRPASCCAFLTLTARDGFRLPNATMRKPSTVGGPLLPLPSAILQTGQV